MPPQATDALPATNPPIHQMNSVQNSPTQNLHSTINEGSSTGLAETVAVAAATEKPTTKQDKRRTTGLSRLAGKFLSLLRHNYSSYFKDWWALEILCLLFSMTCLINITVILSIYRDRPLSAWRMPISINSLISLLVALAKSAMLFSIATCIGQLMWPHFLRSSHFLIDIQHFDNATRGPFSALHLLFRLGNGSLVAALGSLLTFAALAIDPFAQQIISFPSHLSVSRNDSATIAVAQSYDSGISNTNFSTLFSLPDILMQGAVYRGLYALPGNTLFQCGSGSCSWPEFASLGVCSSSLNVTSETQTACMSSMAPGENTTKLKSANDMIVPDASTVCDYTTPQGFKLRAKSATYGTEEIIDITVIYSTPRESVRLSNPNATITTFPVLDGSHSPTMPFGDVYECQLYWCARRYSNAKVIDGTLHTSEPDVLPLEYDTSRFTSIIDLPVMTPRDSYAMKVQDPPQDYQLNSTFTIKVGDFVAIKNFLEGIFTVTGHNGTMNSPIAFLLQKRTNISQLVENIANSMSDNIRSGANATQIHGTADRPITFIHVRWAWLMLPAGLIVSSCVLLTITIIVTSRQQNGVLWKSSPLALLFNGLEEEKRQMVSSLPAHATSGDEKPRAPTTLAEMEFVAKAMRVQLLTRNRKEGGFKLMADL